MRLLKYFILFSVLALGCKSNLPFGYDYTPVLLHLDKNKQHDSIGYNLASEIPKLVYAKILSNDIALWSSPDKQVQITPNSFIEMEKTAMYPFVESNNFFIHEVWRIYKRNYSFGVIGFSFAGETRSGRKINYGYIDATDVIELMRARNIPSNANGSGYLSFWDALHSKTYNFNLVQFGKDDFKANPMRSFELKDQAIYSSKIKRNLYQIRLDKEIEYKILSPSINSNPDNSTLYKTFEKFVNDNKQTILNAGGDEYFTHIANTEWKIDNIIITEKWSKFNSLPFQELLKIQLFIKGKGITLKKKDLDEMGIKINLQGPEEYLSGKSFSFVIMRINNQEILNQDSEYYYQSLLNGKWNKLKK